KVRIFNDSVTVWFDAGEYNTKTKDLDVASPIRILYDTRTFTANALEGNLDNDIYRASGQVEIRDSISFALADSILFDREKDRAFLYGNAMMSDTVNHITMRGSELEYHLDTDRFYGRRDASVYETLDDGTKRFEVFAGTLEGDMEKGWLIAVDSVFVRQDSSGAWCDSLFYLDSTQTVYFFGNAHLQYQDIDMYAPAMTLNFQRNHLGSLIAKEDPKVTLREEGFLRETGGKAVSRTSVMTGKYLQLEFNAQDEPEWMDMAGMVSSDYHVFKDSVYKGMNRMTSDTVHIEFEDGDVRDLFAIYGIEGSFIPDTSYDEMDSTVYYYCDKAHYDLRKDNMKLYPGSNMMYGNIKLRADTLKIDWKTNILYALPQKKGGELPEFIQGDDPPVYGDLFEYNLDTQRGRITRGKTNIKEGYYHGKTVLKTEEEPLWVSKGVVTTCDRDEPHFCLEAKRMKVIPGDRVFAQDIVFKIMDIPLLYIPSLFVPIEEGNRRSGWILPHFGTYPTKGWALEGGGYYWAPNDYYDARAVVDFYDNQGITAELRQRYAWKDHISNGSLTATYWNYFLRSTTSAGYKINIVHPQQIGLKSSLNISGTFTSDAKHFTEELDQDDRLEQQMVSSASFRTTLGPFSVNVNASRTEDLLTGTTKTSFPQFSISKATAKIIKRKNMSEPEKWYHKFTYSVRSELSNQMTHIWNASDSLFIDDTRNKFQTSGGVRYSDKLFGFLTVSPYLNYYEDWTTLYKAPVMRNDSALVDSNGTLVLEERNAFKRRGRFDLGTSASTTLYGVFNINIGPLKAIRHTMTMSMTYQYQPDLSMNPEYVFRGIGTNGEEVKHDYFTGTLLGKTPDSQSQTFVMNFNHNFESKVVSRDGKENKTLFLNLKHGYNFLADSLRNSLITATSTIKDLPGGMSLKIDAAFDPYAYRINNDGVSVTRIDQLAVPRLTSLRIGTNLSLKPVTQRERKSETPGTASDSADYRDKGKALQEPPRLKVVPGADAGFSNWSITSGISFTSTASNPLNIKNRLLINTTVKANLTPKWSGSYIINFDVLEQAITDQRLTLTRDLHCWTLSLDWDPGDSFFISLNAKATMLKALKLEKRTGRNY
ncbi:MAG: hypothetical protein JXR21_02825, partial [Candidatus Marinimicrobia bacterium]|nr:hypothetical protein [Candidatus Neomarinimicrobiota bacterium]